MKVRTERERRGGVQGPGGGGKGRNQRLIGVRERVPVATLAPAATFTPAAAPQPLHTSGAPVAAFRQHTHKHARTSTHAQARHMPLTRVPYHIHRLARAHITARPRQTRLATCWWPCASACESPKSLHSPAQPADPWAGPGGCAPSICHAVTASAPAHSTAKSARLPQPLAPRRGGSDVGRAMARAQLGRARTHACAARSHRGTSGGICGGSLCAGSAMVPGSAIGGGT